MEERLKAAFTELADAVGANWKGAALAIVEAQTAGHAGLLRLRRATATFEQMLASSFAHASECSALPRPVIRGIAGGLHGAISACVREGCAAEIPALAEEMLRWTLLFQTPAAERMAERLLERAHASANGYGARGAQRSNGANGGQRSNRASASERERLLEQALRLAVVEDYRELSAPQIAEEAGVPIDVFFELFADKGECFLAALDMLGDELLRRAADPDLVSSDWPSAVRRVIGEMMRFLAEHPIYAQTIARGAFVAGPEAIERNLELSNAIAALLTEGAPGKARSRLALEGVAGAISHTIRCHVASDQMQLLPVLSDYLAYIVLAPFIGADAAASFVAEEEP